MNLSMYLYANPKKKDVSFFRAQYPNLSTKIPEELSQIKINKKRPLKQVSQNLSFKGRFFDVDKMLKSFGEEIGEGAKKNLTKKIIQASNTKGSGLVFDEAKNIIEITQEKKSKHIIKTLLYPVTKMPLDIINSSLSAFKKFKLTKNIKIFDNILDIKLLKNRHIELENSANVASIEKCFESFKNGKFDKDFFKNSHGRLNLKVGNYDSTNERAMTRLCTGIVPAFFLANDAYNLSVFVSNDKKNASKAKKRRFNQEVTRIGITSIATLLALKMFSKTSNKNGNAASFIITGVTVLSELLGRALAGNPIWFINKNRAKEYAEKRDMKKNTVLSVKKNKDNKSNNETKSILTLKNVIKVLGAMLITGFSADMIGRIPQVNKLKNKFLNSYNSFLKKEFTISKNDFNNIISKLNENGFEGLSNKYQSIVDDVISNGNLTSKEKALIAKNPDYKITPKTNDIINLGEVSNKFRYVAIHQILTFPIRYVWNLINFPYSKVVKPIVNKIKNVPPKVKDNVTKDTEILINSLRLLNKNQNNDKYSDIINNKILSSLDTKTKSNMSNASLSTKVKKMASTASSVFLIADNYNAVMIESKGEDKDLAEQKGKERAIQRIVRIIYGAFFTTLFNSVFESTYNSSMLGAQVVNIADSLVLETMERKAVGLPIGESDKQKIIDLESEYLNAKGLKGFVSRLMAKLTGKKPITQRTKTK